VSKKKRNTFAARSSEANKVSHSSYTLPATYQIFVAEPQEACQQGDLYSKKAIEELAPQIATTLKKNKEANTGKTQMFSEKLFHLK